jgi:putative ABC transport system permease protein
MWQLAIKAMLGDRSKLLVSLTGVAFAVVLVNLQGGLLLGLIHKASLLVDYGGADIWVGHRHMHDAETGSDYIPERWLQRIRNVEGVDRADPYVIVMSSFVLPDGHAEYVVVVGCGAASHLGNPWRAHGGDPHVLRQPHGVLIDECDVGRLGNCRIGDVREIGGCRAQIVGMTRGMVSFTTRPYVFTTLDRARQQFAAGIPPGRCSYFLVKARPGSNVAALVERLRQRVPELEVYDRETYAQMSMIHWFTRTGIGISFGLATFLGVLVGLGVVAQTLYASVTERLKEFATLKALGADDRCVARFLTAQALGNAVLGSVVGLVGAQIIGRVATTPRAPIEMTGLVAIASVVLVTAVCLLAAWLPYRRIRCIDPASVLRG